MRISTGLSLFLVIAGLVATLGCSDEDCIDCGTLSPVSPDFTHRTDVLNNIEESYSKRNVDHYDDLLDDNFTFFYIEGDIGGGGFQVQWGRADEMTITNGLFGAASAIDLNIKWEDGVSWIESVPESAPLEHWYSTTVFYDFAIKIDESTYVPDLGSKATFTVRNAGTDEAPHWQLVEMRDLGGPNSSLALRRAAAVDAVTWAKLKALYR